MDKLPRILTPILAAVFVAVVALSVQTMAASRSSAAAPVRDTSSRAFEYAFFLPSTDNSYFASLRAGALEAAKELNCAVIFHDLSADPLSFEMASYAGTNGVALFSYEKSDAMVSGLERLLNRGIPVVQIENEVVSGPNTVLIGTNGYDSGKAIGKIAATMDRPTMNLALIYSDKNPSLKADANLVEIGAKSVLGDRLIGFATGQTTINPIDAEGVIYELLGNDPRPDIIALTDSNDTLVAIQAIIDLNLVGRVQIIGFGNDQTTMDYIDKGVVLGTIVRRPSEIGFRAVAALTEINRKGNTSAYVNAGIDVVTAGSGQPDQRRSGK